MISFGRVLHGWMPYTRQAHNALLVPVVADSICSGSSNCSSRNSCSSCSRCSSCSSCSSCSPSTHSTCTGRALQVLARHCGLVVYMAFSHEVLAQFWKVFFWSFKIKKEFILALSSFAVRQISSFSLSISQRNSLILNLFPTQPINTVVKGEIFVDLGSWLS